MNKLIVILNSSASKSIFLAVLFGLAFATNGFAATDADSCAANSANRQLDYWLGNWKIGAEGSSGNAHSTVSFIARQVPRRRELGRRKGPLWSERLWI